MVEVSEWIGEGRRREGRRTWGRGSCPEKAEEICEFEEDLCDDEGEIVLGVGRRERRRGRLVFVPCTYISPLLNSIHRPAFPVLRSLNSYLVLNHPSFLLARALNIVESLSSTLGRFTGPTSSRDISGHPVFFASKNASPATHPL